MGAGRGARGSLRILPVSKVLFLSLGVLALLLGGCDESRSGRKAGERCRRSADCEAKLACVSGMCSNDLTPLAEAGIIPPTTDSSIPP